MLPVTAPGEEPGAQQACALSSTQHNTMESLLERGEKIDDLVSKSEVLGVHSKAFYKTVGAAGRGRAPLPASGQHAVPGSPPRLAPPSGWSEMGGEAQGAVLPTVAPLEQKQVEPVPAPPLPRGGAEASARPRPLALAVCQALGTAFLRVLTAPACGSFALKTVTAHQ